VFSQGQVDYPNDRPSLPDGPYRIGIRPHHLMLSQSKQASLEIEASVSTTEIAGSETFIHVSQDDLRLVVLTHGVYRVEIGDQIPIYMNPSKFFIFDGQGVLVSAPRAETA
jgi:glycerol transport system ATP-binding protein